jgi:hypothetical protein
MDRALWYNETSWCQSGTSNFGRIVWMPKRLKMIIRPQQVPILPMPNVDSVSVLLGSGGVDDLAHLSVRHVVSLVRATLALYRTITRAGSVDAFFA